MHGSAYRTGAAVKAISASRRDPTLARIADAVLANRPLGFTEGVHLYRRVALDDIRTLAAHCKQKRHGDRTYYERSLPLVVRGGCDRDTGDAGARRRHHHDRINANRGLAIDARATPADLRRMLLAYVGAGIAGISISTPNAKALAPAASIDWWCALLRAVKQGLPDADINACSHLDIATMASTAGLSIEATLSRLYGAGLASVAGAGPEMGDGPDATRLGLGLWFSVHRCAYGARLTRDAVFGYGRDKAYERRVLGLLAIREFQQQSIACGRPAFARIGVVRQQRGGCRQARGASWDDDLRNHAVARIMAHNIDHVVVDPALDTDMRVHAVAYGVDHFGEYASADAVDTLMRRLYDAGITAARRDRTDTLSYQQQQQQRPPESLADAMWPAAPS
ncbi:Aminodeoxyfutalosine synthase [Pandoravirus salinus]|uniref:Aminodeoxyfutalosine synthase n=1 Tax=Pandoravirus salinus TaxID=1349410 RepID=S4W4Q6_9VIRU|nr:FO synthase subunit domain [Pandoravirus salinus]AGO85325.1 Aminodeoxyfutalosine synthase [Pandoravirus salinus]